MSVTGAIGGFLRGSMIAAATAAAAFGLLVVFQPFGTPATAPAATTIADTQGDAVKGRIEALRLALRDTETALATAMATTAPTGTAATRAQYEAQIAAATERRDLALRHAAAIRTALAGNTSLSSLTAIRDSVVIGQMLTQQAALDGQIAQENARLKAGHPTMRALNAQRTALATQIDQQATNIAAALDAEAELDDAQIALLQAQLPIDATAVPADSVTLEAKAAAQRAELYALVDAYFDIKPAVPAATRPTTADLLSPTNLVVVGVAGLAALLFQIILGARRRRTPRTEDLEAWQSDTDPELDTDLISEAEPLRQAS